MFDLSVSVSIVSHGHGEMVARLVSQLIGYPEVVEIILTKNIPELLPLPDSPKIHILENVVVSGFGKNHNAAFALASGSYFCILNPDVIFINNPFSRLLDRLESLDACLVAPMVLCVDGGVEDSIRYFPTPVSIAKKLIWGDQSRYHFTQDSPSFSPEWVAGMFMLFKSHQFFRIGGFDERYYLYYEDVDICTRIWRNGGLIIAVPQVQIIHDAQRASRNNYLHFKWHIFSMGRYFTKYLWRLPRVGII